MGIQPLFPLIADAWWEELLSQEESEGIPQSFIGLLSIQLLGKLYE